MIIDDHVHLTPERGILGEGGTYPTAEELIEMMDKIGVDKAVVLPEVNPEGTHRIHSIEEVLKVCQKYPDRFIPFCNIDPRLGDNSPDKDFSPILNYYKEKGCKGVGEMCANLYIDDPLCKNLFYHCGKVGLPVLFHLAVGVKYGIYGLADDIHLPRLEKMLKEFPSTIFIGHAMAFWSEISSEVDEETRGGFPKGEIKSPGRVPELLKKYPNLYGDLSAGSGRKAIMRDVEYGIRFLNEFQDRLLFGSDICRPGEYQRLELLNFLRERKEKGEISPEVYEKITCTNVRRVLKI